MSCALLELVLVVRVRCKVMVPAVGELGLLLRACRSAAKPEVSIHRSINIHASIEKVSGTRWLSLHADVVFCLKSLDLHTVAET